MWNTRRRSLERVRASLASVQEDVERVFATGYFATCTPEAEDTRDGVRLTINLEPNPELKVRAIEAQPGPAVSNHLGGRGGLFGREREKSTTRPIATAIDLRPTP